MTGEIDLIHKQELIKERNQTAGDVSGLLFNHVNIRKSISRSAYGCSKHSGNIATTHI